MQLEKQGSGGNLSTYFKGKSTANMVCYYLPAVHAAVMYGQNYTTQIVLPGTLCELLY